MAALIPLLLVEDDLTLGEDLTLFLHEHGFEMTWVKNVPDARRAFSESAPAVCLVDIVLEGPTGKVFCREVADTSSVGVIMMSSIADEETIITLLEIGADDYIVKPFKFREMLARLRSVLRRSQRQDHKQALLLSQIGTNRLDLARRTLTRIDGVVLPLSQSEAEVLRFLGSSPGAVFSREDLLAVSRKRQYNGVDDRAVDHMVTRLRKKVEVDPANPQHILTVRGEGYKLVP